MIWASQVARDIDQLTTTRYGIASSALMEEAGLAVARFAMEIWKPGLRILIVAGAGNNGGDAFVAARYLAEAGFSPAVLSVMADAAAESPERKAQRLLYENLGHSVLSYRSAQDLARFSPSTLIIDGLLGLGPKQPLRPGLIRDCLRDLGALKARFILAIDLPSGLLADDWQPDDVPLAATHTITFGAAKPLHRMEPGRSHCGIVRVIDLPFHAEAIADSLQKTGCILEEDREILPDSSPWSTLPADAHKYTRGHVLVIGGSAGKLGAPILAAEAALHAGAGWVSVAFLDAADRPPLPRALTYENFGVELEPLSTFLKGRRVKALVIGPGTMQNPLTAAHFQRLQTLQDEHKLFLVFDAGALKNWMALAKGLCFDPTRTVLTPHPGEWRAMGPAQVDLNNLESLAGAWELCRTFGVTVFYKSATPFSISAHQGQRMLVNHDGSRALGKAGSGDVLAGVTAAYGCAGRDAALVANEAQRTVAYAARKAEQVFGPDGLGPDELIHHLGSAYVLDARIHSSSL